ncbi:MAG: hypothetical protein QNI93_21790 [Kiloniellales bacterium]|nr:hypothetical protein [Kiloniellales bacterium]
MAARLVRRILLAGLWGLTGALLLTAAALVGLAFFGEAPSGETRFIALGALWFWISPGSLNLIQAVTERYLSVALWDHVVFPLVQQPAVLVFGLTGAALGLLSWLLGRRRRA